MFFKKKENNTENIDMNIKPIYQVIEHTRDKKVIWNEYFFATVNSNGFKNIKDCAEVADYMLTEYLKRFTSEQ